MGTGVALPTPPLAPKSDKRRAREGPGCVGKHHGPGKPGGGGGFVLLVLCCPPGARPAAGAAAPCTSPRAPARGSCSVPCHRTSRQGTEGSIFSCGTVVTNERSDVLVIMNAWPGGAAVGESLRRARERCGHGDSVVPLEEEEAVTPQPRKGRPFPKEEAADTQKQLLAVLQRRCGRPSGAG